MKSIQDELQGITRAIYVWHEEFLRNPDGSINTSPQPQAFACNVDIKRLSSGELYSGFVTNQGYLYCWAWKQEIKDRSDLIINPIPITSIGEFVCDVSCGSSHISCFTESNSLYIWKFPNSSPDFSEESINQKTPLVLNKWDFPISSISSGKDHILVLLSNNSLYSVNIYDTSEFQENNFETKISLVKGVSDKITQIIAGTDFSVCLTENNLIHYWSNSNEEDVGDNCEFQTKNLNMKLLLSEDHACDGENCILIKSISIQKNLILLGALFTCDPDGYGEIDTLNSFTHIYSFNHETNQLLLVKDTIKNKMFKSFHSLFNYVCIIYFDDTIFFKNLYVDEENVMIRTKGEIKLSNVTAKGKCLIMNVLQHETTLRDLVEDNACKEGNRDELTKSDDFEINQPESNLNNVGLTVCQVSEHHIPSNTTFYSSDQECGSYKEAHDIPALELEASVNSTENKFSYSRPTISSSIALKEIKTNRHPFLRKGEGKNCYIKPGSDKAPSNLASSRKLDIQGNINGKISDKNNDIRKIHQAKIIELENENKRILGILEETNKQYYKDMKTLYEQLKDKNDEKFPLKTVVERLQRELFIEKEEKRKLNDEYETVKSKLQVELNTKNIKRDLLNTQLIIERDNLAKENQDLKNKYADLNNKYMNLEIILAEISSKYHESIQENDKLKKKYEEMDQVHTETINQLSKIELEIYSLKKENESLRIPNRIQNISTNELYEYIDKLEKNIKDMNSYCNENHCEKSELIKLKDKTSIDNNNINLIQNKYLEKYNHKFTKISEFIKCKIKEIRQNDFDITKISCTDQSTDFEIERQISELIDVMAQRIKQVNLRNKSLEKKVNILENCIKTRREDVNIIAENEITAKVKNNTENPE